MNQIPIVPYACQLGSSITFLQQHGIKGFHRAALGP